MLVTIPIDSVKLHELFGLAETPRIGAPREAVLLALLAPDGRPGQKSAARPQPQASLIQGSLERRADVTCSPAVDSARATIERSSGRTGGQRMKRMKRVLMGVAAGVVAACLMVSAQERMPSPTGTAATEVGGKYNNAAEPEYIGGKWIEITYGRPIKRGRDLWGSWSGLRARW